MARRVIGSVWKGKDPKRGIIVQIRKDLKEPIVLQAGEYLSVESKKLQLESLAEAEQLGKIDADYAAKRREQINKIADWSLGDLVLNTKS